MTHQKTFYVGDPIPTDLYDFAEEIRDQSGSRKIRHIPLSLAKMAAVVGDIFKAIGWLGVPLSSFRLNNITTEYTFDLSPIISITGEVPFSLKEGIFRSLEWMKSS
jgi:nucleoside-diphosphate-sugar epimerase